MGMAALCDDDKRVTRRPTYSTVTADCASPGFFACRWSVAAEAIDCHDGVRPANFRNRFARAP
jgi:hypothetical protein